MATDDEEALIARLRHAFAENTKSRSEAAEIRSDLAAKVKSYIGHDGPDKHIPSRVELPGKEITGIRRRYLEALKANIEDRGRYQRLATSARKPQKEQPEQFLPQEKVVLSHLESSRLQKHHQELDIRQRYLRSVSQDAAIICSLSISQPELRNDCDNNDELDDHIATSTAEVKAVTSKLQKAVLQANHQLERQKLLLAEVKQAQAPVNPKVADLNARSRAIASTRDVLVTWLDEKLSDSGADRADSVDDSHEEPESEFIDSQLSISEHYQRYLNARRGLLDAAKQALQPLPVQDHVVDEVNQEVVVGDQMLHPDDLSLVHTISQRLLPLLRQKADFNTLRSYLSAQTVQECKATLDALERLGDESHLMSTFSGSGIESKDELTGQIAAWTSATKAASGSAVQVIEEHTRVGQNALTIGEEALVVLNSYNDHDHEDRVSKDDGINWKGIHGKLETDNVL